MWTNHWAIKAPYSYTLNFMENCTKVFVCISEQKLNYFMCEKGTRLII